MISVVIAVMIILLDLILGFIVLSAVKVGSEYYILSSNFFVALWVGANILVDVAPSQYIALLATRATFFLTSWAMFFYYVLP